MNRRFTIFALLLMSAALLFPQKSQAQIQVGAAFGTDTEIGLTAGYYTMLSVGDVEGLNVGVDAVFYLPQSEDVGGFGSSGEVTTTFFEINVNGHYDAIEVGEGGVGYAIGGLQYARASVDADVDGFGSFGFGSYSEVGLNIGAGVGIGRFFGEAKFSVGGFEQLAISGGVKF